MQIYVGGPTLARGYLNRPEMNAKRFIKRPNTVPASVGDRLYRTGDWGYLLSDGNLEICGRCDTMVKIRGYSIEVQVRYFPVCKMLHAIVRDIIILFYCKAENFTQIVKRKQNLSIFS